MAQELKAINAYQLTTNTEDSVVYIHNGEFGCGGDLVECYLKSEADKVIAELKEKLKEQTSIAEEGWKEFRTYHTSYAEAVEELYEKNKELRHHKYKRCLAMAKWCYAKWDDTATKYYKSVWYRKWEVKWLALAEKFKEVDK